MVSKKLCKFEQQGACLGNVLISSASQKVPLIRAMQAAVNKIDDRACVVAGDSDSHVSSRFVADSFWHMPRLNELNLSLLLDECRNQGIKFVLPTRDWELDFWAEFAPELYLSGINVIVSSRKTINLCLDKLRFSIWGADQNLPIIPSSIDPADFDCESLVVKERFGPSRQEIGLALPYQDAINHADKLDEPIFQPMIYGKEISVDAYLTLDCNVHGLVMRYRNRVKLGESQITTTFQNRELETQLIDVLNQLGLSGPVVMQAIVTNSILNVVEVNPRFGGASTASIAVGLDTFYWSILERNNPDSSLPNFVRDSLDIRQIRTTQDIIIYDSDF